MLSKSLPPIASPRFPRFQVAPVLTLTTALLALLPTNTVPTALATVLEIMLTPPRMFQVPLMVKLVFEANTMAEAVAATAFEVVSVAPVPKLKNELVVVVVLLVTNKLSTERVPLLKFNQPPPTLRMLTLVTVPPEIVNTLPVAAPLPTVRFCVSRFQTALLSTLTVLLEEPMPTSSPPLQRFALVTVS